MNFQLLLLVIASFTLAQCENRTRRHLIYPVAGGIFKLILGIGIPVKLGMRQSMAVGMNFQFQYTVPKNITELEKPYPPIIAKSRDRRMISNDRNLFYFALESSMNRKGLNGRSCTLQSICNNAKDTLNHDANGLFGELLHIAFTPLVKDSKHTFVEKDDESLYVDAQRAGEYGADCQTLYPDCPDTVNLFDSFSLWDN